jgi:hypothetical protein
MKKLLLLNYTLLLVAFALVFACHPPPEFPVEPHIEFKALESHPILFKGAKLDSLVIITRFEDGDGDLGLSSEDLTVPPFKDGDNGVNYIIEAFLKRTTETTFNKINLPGVSGRFFPLNPDKRIGPLEGDLRYGGVKVPEFNPVFNIKEGDQMKFTVKIRDRALHTSNTVETTPVTITFPK